MLLQDHGKTIRRLFDLFEACLNLFHLLVLAVEFSKMNGHLAWMLKTLTPYDCSLGLHELHVIQVWDAISHDYIHGLHFFDALNALSGSIWDWDFLSDSVHFTQDEGHAHYRIPSSAYHPTRRNDFHFNVAFWALCARFEFAETKLWPSLKYSPRLAQSQAYGKDFQDGDYVQVSRSRT